MCAHPYPGLQSSVTNVTSVSSAQKKCLHMNETFTLSVSIMNFSCLFPGTGELVQPGCPPLLAAAASEEWRWAGRRHAGRGHDGRRRGWFGRGHQSQEDLRQGSVVVRTVPHDD